MRLPALTLLAASLAAAANAAEKQPIVPEGMEWLVAKYGFSPAVRIGDFVFASGVVASLPKDVTGAPAAATDENLEAAYELAFADIGIVLAAAGASWSDIVDMTSYHTELPGQLKAFMAVRNRHIAAPYPAWTAIDVDRLVPERGVTEIKIVVYAPKVRR